MAFDREAAKQAGWLDAEIDAYLAKQKIPEAPAATEPYAGMSKREIAQRMTTFPQTQSMPMGSVDDLMRQLGLTARAGITGATAIPTMMADALTGLVNAGTGQQTMMMLTANMDRVNIDGNYFEGYRNDTLLNGVQIVLNDSTYRKDGTQMTDYYYCRSLNFSNNTIENFRYLTALSQTAFAKQTDWRMDNNKGYILWHPDYVSDYTYGLLIPPGANANNNWFITPYMNNYSFPYIVYGVKSTGNYQKLRGGTLTNSKAEGGNYPFNVDPFNASPYHCVLKNNTGYSGTIRWGTDANTYKLGDSGNDIFTNATLTNYTPPKRFGIGENKSNY